MDVEAMLLEQALRERVDVAFERLRNGTAVYLSHSEVEKRMAIFKAKIWGRYWRGGIGSESNRRFLRIEWDFVWQSALSEERTLKYVKDQFMQYYYLKHEGIEIKNNKGGNFIPPLVRSLHFIHESHPRVLVQTKYPSLIATHLKSFTCLFGIYFKSQRILERSFALS
ncbi:hypothetical protein [Serratia marcescens]|uniref:hypothetical protein n=1 Tax=Serratia marcescens TaxID=615 RepID=UPI00313E67CD